MKVLLAGCGGVGLEILKILSKDKSYSITIVDYDRIELSNLNRLFLFSTGDIGKYKSKETAKLLNCNFLIKDCLEFTVEDLEDYDCIILAVDNIQTRMHLNYLFKMSTCQYLLDCGVLGDSCHSLLTYRKGFCLYCIKELYETNDLLNLCTLKYLNSINKDNRFQILKSFCFSESFKGVEEIVDLWNTKVEEKYKTSPKEVQFILDKTVPSICYTNSICASLGLSLLKKKRKGFIFYNSETPQEILNLERDEDCILCKKYPK